MAATSFKQNLDSPRTINRKACMLQAIRVLIKLTNGTSGLARLLDIDRKTIYNWTRNGRVPVEPVNYCIQLEALTGLPRWFIRPDIYDWPRGSSVPTPFGNFILAE